MGPNSQSSQIQPISTSVISHTKFCPYIGILLNKSKLVGSPPPRGRSPPPSRSAYSPPRGAPMGRDLDRDRVRDYSPGSRRPAPYDSSRGGPPIKRSRPDDGLSRSLPPRDGPPRGIVRDMPMRDSLRGPPRDSGRGGLGSFRR